MSWRDWPRAPAPGTVLCRAADLGRTLSLDLDGFALLLVHSPEGPRAYVNACPHQYLPLDFHGPEILSGDGARLICSAHQACFDAASGGLICGPADEGLEPVPLSEIAGSLVISGG